MSKINFVGLHAHTGVGSPFDGLGKPEDHMEFAYANGSRALAVTDHGNMNATRLSLSRLTTHVLEPQLRTKQSQSLLRSTTSTARDTLFLLQ